ncbi:phosphoethanolamine transferase [Photobacterium swingsii]|uniref:phosphoethanolamine transferase n=1 Tax=Photobacterium swingsii TaxID=680026 RepID=UPI00406934A6
MKKKYFFWLILTSLLPYFYLIATTGSSNLGHGTPLINIILITLCCTNANKKISHILKAFVSILFFIQLNSVFYYNAFLSYGAFSSIMETNSNEAFGFISEFGFLGLFTSLLLASFFFVISSKLTITIKTKHKVALVIALLFLHPIRWAVSGSKSLGEFVSEPYFKLNNLYYYTLLNPFFNYATYKSEIAFLSEPDSFKLPKHVINDGHKSNYKHIYLVLGESATKRHYSSYGYEYPTTPFLDSILKDPHYYQVENAISPAPITRESLKRNLSFSTVENKNGYSDYINIINAAKNKGYETNWLSSQSNSGIHDSLIGKIGSSSDYYVFNNPDDENLFNLVYDKFNKDKQQFFVLHLAGSHLPYVNYTKQDLDTMNKSNSPYPEYDATILKTDRLLQKVIDKAINDANSLVVYLSDHGEEVNVGHGLPHMSAEQYEIPFIIYDTTQRPDRNLIDSMRTNNNFNTERLMEYMMIILGYEVDTKELPQNSGVVLDVKNRVASYNYS